MERLTKFDYENYRALKPKQDVVDKLGELEDILESWHIENLEELKTRLHDCQVYHLQNNSNETLIHNLKNELSELKQKAIVPKKIVNDFYDEIRHRAILEDDYCPDHNFERKYGLRKCVLEDIRTTILKKYGEIDE